MTYISRLLILCFYITTIIACNSNKYQKKVTVDTITTNEFLKGQNLCDLVLAKGFEEINPKMFPWATDISDTFSESYLIDGKKLKIVQPLKAFGDSDSFRRYSYGDKIIKTKRVIFDNLNFNFNDITIDYGNFPRNIYRKKMFILLRNEPTRWTGLANQYAFVQLFDLKNFICYEFFSNYYSCLNK